MNLFQEIPESALMMTTGNMLGQTFSKSFSRSPTYCVF